jgi:hypothetical protein
LIQVGERQSDRTVHLTGPACHGPPQIMMVSEQSVSESARREPSLLRPRAEARALLQRSEPSQRRSVSLAVRADLSPAVFRSESKSKPRPTRSQLTRSESDRRRACSAAGPCAGGPAAAAAPRPDSAGGSPSAAVRPSPDRDGGVPIVMIQVRVCSDPRFRCPSHSGPRSTTLLPQDIRGYRATAQPQ